MDRISREKGEKKGKELLGREGKVEELYLLGIGDK